MPMDDIPLMHREEEARYKNENISGSSIQEIGYKLLKLKLVVVRKQ